MVSSLLVALPAKEWLVRSDTYERTEAGYIAKVEVDLFYVEGQAICRLLVYLLETKTNLKLDRIEKVFMVKTIYASYIVCSKLY